MTSAELRAELLNARVRDISIRREPRPCRWCGRNCHDEAERLRSELDRITGNSETGAANSGLATERSPL